MECLSPSHTLLLKPLSLSLLGKTLFLLNVQSDNDTLHCVVPRSLHYSGVWLMCVGERSGRDTAFKRSMSCQQQTIFLIIKPINAHHLDFSSKITTLQNMLLVFGNVDVFQAGISFQWLSYDRRQSGFIMHPSEHFALHLVRWMSLFWVKGVQTQIKLH